MGYGHKTRGPVGRISGISRVESADVVLRVRALERISGPAPIDSRPPPQRSFAEVLERYGRGLGSAEPVPGPVHRRPPLPRALAEEDDEPQLPPERLPESFVGILWWKLKTRF
jgi:hypothetical protein